MAEDVARAVGSGGSESVTINGRSFSPRPLTVKELGELERECLASYRRSYIQTFSENLDLLPEKDRMGLVAEKMAEAARFDLKSLPSRYAYDPKRIEITDALKRWAHENMDGYFQDENDRSNAVYQAVIAAALDGDFLSEQQYAELTGKEPKRTRLSYAHWWTTGCFEGRLAMACKSFEGSGFTKEEISKELSSNPGKLLKVAREVEQLTVPEVGNG